MLKIAIIDDEKDARHILRLLLERHLPNSIVIFEADSVKSARFQLQQQSPDLILLDLMMTDGTGFDLLEYFPNPTFKVIFTTAHDQFALRAFEYHALAYLLKPIDLQQLQKEIQYAQATLNLTTQSTQLANIKQSYQEKKLTRLFLPDNDGFIVIKIADIVYLEADGNYTHIYTTDKKLLITKSLKHLADILPPTEFFRVHQSYIVRLDAITAFSKADGDQLTLSLDKSIPVARRRRNELLNWLKKEGSI